MTDLYQMQRGMRAMRRAANARGVIAILDIGTSKVGCFVLRVDEGPEVSAANDNGPHPVGPMAGQARVRVIGAAATRSRGVRFGEIEAMSETERAIRTAVQAAQKMAGVRVDHAIACISGARPESYLVAGEVELEDERCTEADVARALADCELPEIGAGRHVLHAQPVNFALDHRSGLRDPRGQLGARLAADMHLMTVEADAIGNLSQALRRCDLELAGVVSGAYAAGLSALVEDEQELGAACVDIGGGTTGVSIFLKRHMVHAGCVRIGGDYVTSDISELLGVPLVQAERIKNLHGGVHATGRDDREMIAYGGGTGDWEHDARTTSRAALIGIVRPRVVEILEGVRAVLDEAGFDALPSRSIVLTGGGSLMPGLPDLAGRILGHPVRLGRPLRMRGVPQAHSGAAYAALVGLALFAAHPQDEWWDFDLPADRRPARSLRRAYRWVCDNW